MPKSAMCTVVYGIDEGLRYTSREDAGEFKTESIDHLKEIVAGAATEMPLRRLFDLQHEFPTEWYAFLHPQIGGHKILTLNISRNRFPFIGGDKSVQLETVRLFARTKSGGNLHAKLDPSTAGVQVLDFTLPPPVNPGDLQHDTHAGLGLAMDETQAWTLQLGLDPAPVKFDALPEDEVVECFMVVEFTLQ